jgi:Zn-dependent protease with chaperone function
MTREQFERIVSRSETLIREQPEKYKKSINRFAIFGYIAYSLALLFALSLFAFAVWGLATGYIEFGGVRIVIFAGFISILMLMSMWVKFEAPKGAELTREDAPSLFEDLDRIRAEQDTAEIHQVLLTGSPNAMACSASKFLIFGERLYVVIGVPLLMSLKREELISVLAHELAHHSKAHVQDGNRAYRLVQMWQGLASRLVLWQTSIDSLPMTRRIGIVQRMNRSLLRTTLLR